MIFDSNYFQAIQTAVFYKKKKIQMTKFQFSRFQTYGGMDYLGLGILQKLRTFICFWYFFAIFFLAFSETPFKQFFEESKTTISKQLCEKKLIMLFQAQKCVETCVNCVFKVQPFFLNLSSKVLPDFRTRDTNN